MIYSQLHPLVLMVIMFRANGHFGEIRGVVYIRRPYVQLLTCVVDMIQQRVLLLDFLAHERALKYGSSSPALTGETFCQRPS